jgi:hypothetical protein
MIDRAERVQTDARLARSIIRSVALFPAVRVVRASH